MKNEVKDVIGQTINNGDLVVCSSKSEDQMIFRVMKDVSHQTAVKIQKSYNWQTKKTGWTAAEKSSRLYTLARTLKIPDEIFIEMNPELYQVMIEVRKKLNIDINKNTQSLEALRRLLSGI